MFRSLNGCLFFIKIHDYLSFVDTLIYSRFINLKDSLEILICRLLCNFLASIPTTGPLTGIPACLSQTILAFISVELTMSTHHYHGASDSLHLILTINANLSVVKYDFNFDILYQLLSYRYSATFIL